MDNGTSTIKASINNNKSASRVSSFIALQTVCSFATQYDCLRTLTPASQSAYNRGISENP